MFNNDVLYFKGFQLILVTIQVNIRFSNIDIINGICRTFIGWTRVYKNDVNNRLKVNITEPYSKLVKLFDWFKLLFYVVHESKSGSVTEEKWF